MLVSKGHDAASIFKDIYAQCELTLTTRAARQRLADHIAKISAIDVFTTGEVPDGLEEQESWFFEWVNAGVVAVYDK